uniref:Importin N-terminal domain-containing protein n=1 Tax=Trypanosoma congolense (strain IL3000) TaxID=1068625 RepID=G0V053_TRYCI|nr:conserved hypothetical protein [Trypanosoma congolense IL3000]
MTSLASEELTAIFTATLSADKVVRNQAESTLTDLSADPNFVPHLIKFSCHDLHNAGVAAQNAQHAAAIRVRNVLSNSNWNDNQYFTEEVKVAVRECIVPLQCSSHVPDAVRRQLLAATQDIISYDYPDRWPTLMLQPMTILQGCINILSSGGDSPSTPLYTTAVTQLRAVLGVFLACCKHHDNPINVDAEAVDGFADVAVPLFTPLVELLGRLWTQETFGQSQGSDACTFEISPQHTVLSECLHIVFKCLYTLTSSRWPRFLCKIPEMERFCRICVVQPLGAVHDTLLPLYRQRMSIGIDDIDGREGELFAETNESPVWRFLKWLMKLSLQLVQDLMFPKRCETRVRNAAKYFCSHILPCIVQQSFQLVRWHATPRHVTSKAYIIGLEIITAAVEHRATYSDIVAPNTEELLTQLLFPRFAFSLADEELWSANPVEYVRRQADPAGDLYSARIVSANLMLALTASTHSFSDTTTMAHFMQFILQQLSTYSSGAACGDAAATRVVDASLFAIFQFAGVLDVAEFGSDKIEWLLMEYVVPATTYPAGVLRARGVLVLSAYSRKVKWSSPQAYQRVVGAVLPLLQDADVPVRIQACTVLAPLICHPSALEVVTPCIAEVIQHYFTAMRVMDNESVVRTLRKTIAYYRGTLSQWALELVDMLVQCFEGLYGRTASTEHADAVLDSLDAEAGKKRSKAFSLSEGDVTDTIMAADEVLDTLITVVRSLPQEQGTSTVVDPASNLLLRIQHRIAPILYSVLAQESGSSFGFMDAALMLLTTTLSKSTSISPGTWTLLLCLHRLISLGSADYFSQMLPPLDNFVCVAPQLFLSTPMSELCEVPTFAAGFAHLTPAQVVSVMCDAVLSGGSDLRLCELAAVPKIYDSLLQNLWAVKRKEECASRVSVANGLAQYVTQTAVRVLGDEMCRKKPRSAFVVLFVNSIFSAILADTELTVSSLHSAGALTPLIENYIGLVRRKEVSNMLRSYDRRLFVLAVTSLTEIALTLDSQLSACVGELLCGIFQSSVLMDYSVAESTMIMQEVEKRKSGEIDEDEWSDGFDDDDDDSALVCGEDEEDDDESDVSEEGYGDSDNSSNDGSPLQKDEHLKSLLMAAAAARGDAVGDDGEDDDDAHLFDEGDFVSPIDVCNPWMLLLDAVNHIVSSDQAPNPLFQTMKNSAVQQQLLRIHKVSDMMVELMALREASTRKG